MLEDTNILNYWHHRIVGFLGFESLQDLLFVIGRNLLTALSLVILFNIIRRIGTKSIKKTFALRFSRFAVSAEQSERRRHTLESLALNIWRYGINIVTVVSVIQIFVPLNTFLASAGFLTVIITFASQSMLADIVTGFFIVFEDTFAVGDVVETAGSMGTVVEIGIRSTKIQQLTGEIVVLPNREIQRVANFSISNSKAVLDVPVSYEANLEAALDALEKVAEKAVGNYPEIISRPVISGIQALGPNEMTIRVMADVEPLQKAYIERHLRKLVKLTFDEEGIPIAVPRMIIIPQKEAGPDPE